MTAARPLPSTADLDAVDQFVWLNGVTWKDYEAILTMRGERSVPRVTYVEGVLELMGPSRFHETDKKRFARLLEAWSEEMGVKLEGVGSWTLKDERADRGAEPDECYTINRIAETDEDRPDVAIEVIWTSGGINKLEVYRKLGVREVWFYERGTLRFFTLRGEHYKELARSELLPIFGDCFVPHQPACEPAHRRVMQLVSLGDRIEGSCGDPPRKLVTRGAVHQQPFRRGCTER